MVGRRFANNHSLDEYLCRLDANMDDLTKLNLNDLYDEYLPTTHDIAHMERDIEAGKDPQLRGGFISTSFKATQVHGREG